MRLAQESRPEGISSLYIYRGPGSYEPLARVDKAGKEGPTRILYFHTDVNGAPEEMTDSDGKIVWETGYQVWGNTIQEKDHGRVEQNLRYQGQYLDRETGLHYNLHRYYDPDVGRFMVTDPIGLAGGINLYQYAPNPLSWIDPLGLSCYFNSKSNRWHDRQTGRFTKRPTDPSELVHNGQINYGDITQWAHQGGISNQWSPSSQFPSGGFNYKTSSGGVTYSVHGHGINPKAAASYPGSNSAQGPTASITTRPTGGAYSTQTNTISNGTKIPSQGRTDPLMDQSHIPMTGSPY
ncbi:RHS domain-containing protein [Escherichia coli]